jgi:oxalate decarboxylase
VSSGSGQRFFGDALLIRCRSGGSGAAAAEFRADIGADRQRRGSGPRERRDRRRQSGCAAPARHRSGDVPSFWHSFSLAHRRVQDGGWARQVNQDEFPIAEDLAGVNMKLDAGGIRELHRHAADEWARMLDGNCRLTAIDLHGRSYVPRTLGHYIENIGDTDLVFLEMFKANSYADLSLNDWLTHIPPELVAQHLGFSPETIATIPKDNFAILPETAG